MSKNDSTSEPFRFSIFHTLGNEKLIFMESPAPGKNTIPLFYMSLLSREFSSNLVMISASFHSIVCQLATS